jgi:hypothetical protein
MDANKVLFSYVFGVYVSLLHLTDSDLYEQLVFYRDYFYVLRQRKVDLVIKKQFKTTY